MGRVAMERFVQKVTIATRKKTNNIRSLGRRGGVGPGRGGFSLCQFLEHLQLPEKKREINK
jgi:hypothetical protein